MKKHSFENIAILHASDGINQYKLKFIECTTSLIVSLDRTTGCAEISKEQAREGLIIG